MEITVKDVMKIIKRFICLIVLITVLGGAMAGFYTFASGGINYSAEAKFLCRNSSGNIEDLKGHIDSDLILTTVVLKVKNNYPEITTAQLKDMVSLQQEGNTKYVTLSIVHKESDIAYFVCKSYLDVIMDELKAFVAEIITMPTPNSTIAQSDYMRNIIIGAVFGFAIAILIAFIFATTNKSIYSRSDIEKYFDLKVLGAIPKGKKEESLKILRSNAINSILNGDAKTIAVASVGKKKKFCSLSAIGEWFGFYRDYQGTAGRDLAISLAESGKKTIYIDALNNGDGQYGLNDYLMDNQEKNPILVTGNKNLFVIKGGKKVEDAVALLSSGKMKRLLTSLKKQCDCIIIDLPPMCGNADAVCVHNVVDGYVLSAKLKINSIHQVNNSLGTLNQLSASVYGLIIENASQAEVFGGRMLTKRYE